VQRALSAPGVTTLVGEGDERLPPLPDLRPPSGVIPARSISRTPAVDRALRPVRGLQTRMVVNDGQRPLGRFGAGVVALVVLAAVAAPKAAAGSSPLTMQNRVLHARQFGGFAPIGTVQDVITSADDWSTQSAVPVAELKQEGFIRGIWENLHWAARDWDALSCVAQFRSAGAAREAVSAQIAAVKKQGSIKVTRFPVAGIPGAQAFKAVGPVMTGYDIEFADGPFWYLVAYGFRVGSGLKTGTKADVIAAGHALYARVHGKPPG
jgi:hypothetical protein